MSLIQIRKENLPMKQNCDFMYLWICMFFMQKKAALRTTLLAAQMLPPTNPEPARYAEACGKALVMACSNC